MPSRLGAHADRVREVRELLSVKGRREQQRFVFEGATQLDEAMRGGVQIEALYVTESIYEASQTIAELERRGTAVYLVDDRVASKISDLETPTGVLAVAPLALCALDVLFEQPGVVLVLADLNDPGNAGTLLRSAEAFGAAGVIFGSAGVDPYHPKVVRGAMGAIFRLRIAIATPAELRAAASACGAAVLGLDTGGASLKTATFGTRSALVVGHERRGLGLWADICAAKLSIEMHGQAESLNAGVAGSIGLYEATRPG